MIQVLVSHADQDISFGSFIAAGGFDFAVRDMIDPYNIVLVFCMDWLLHSSLLRMTL